MGTTILYVCDNRDEHSWGSRGSSVALGQQLTAHGRLAGVSRGWATTAVPVGPVIGPVYRHRHGARIIRRVLRRDTARRLLSKLGNHGDFVDLDPRRTVSRFLQAARSDPELAWLKQQLDEADIVVINGEGSLVLRDPPRRDLNFQLFVAQLAVDLGKPVSYLNALASDCPYSGTNAEVAAVVQHTLRQCTSVVVRDAWSQRRLEDLGLRSVALVPDALFTWADRYRGFLDGPVGRENPDLFECWPESDEMLHGWSYWPADYVCLTGASCHPYQDVSGWRDFAEALVRRIRWVTGMPVVLVDSGGDAFLGEVALRTNCPLIRPPLNLLLATYLLSNARGVVGGRFHPGIMASLGGTPCTFLESNAHKTLSLQEQLGYSRQHTYPLDPATANVAAVVHDLEGKLNGGSALRDEIRDRSSLLGRDAREKLSRIVGALSAPPRVRAER